MKYQRKTVKKQNIYFYLGVWTLAMFAFVFLAAKINKQVEASNKLLSPLPEHYAAWTEVKEVEVLRLPKNVEEEIRLVFGKDAENAIKVAKCESGMRVAAVNDKNTNGSTDVGLFQINSVHGIKAKWLKNQSIQIRVAHQLFLEQGWNPWSASNKCHGLLGK